MQYNTNSLYRAMANMYIRYICIYTHLICIYTWSTLLYTVHSQTLLFLFTLHSSYSCSPTVLSSLARGCLSTLACQGRKGRERKRKGGGGGSISRRKLGTCPSQHCTVHILYKFGIFRIVQLLQYCTYFLYCTYCNNSQYTLGLNQLLLNTVVTFVQLQNY